MSDQNSSEFEGNWEPTQSGGLGVFQGTDSSLEPTEQMQEAQRMSEVTDEDLANEREHDFQGDVQTESFDVDEALEQL